MNFGGCNKFIIALNKCLLNEQEGEVIGSQVITIQKTLTSLDGAGSFWQRGLLGCKPKKRLRADGVLLPFFPLHTSEKRGSVMFGSSFKAGTEDQEDGAGGVSGEQTGDRNHTR